MGSRASFTLALVLLIAGTVGALLLAGHSLANFFLLPPAVAMVLIPLGCTIFAFGVRGPVVVLGAFAAIWSRKHDGSREEIRILSALIGYVYGAGAFVFLAGLVCVLGSVTESGFTLAFRGKATATIVSLIYPVIIAEIVLRPLKHRWSCTEA